MGKRYYIQVGDRTTKNGIVTTGRSNNTLDGNPLSFEKDLIECPACKTTGYILCVGTRISSKDNGVEQALSDDLCICKCDPPPRLIASQNTYSTEGEASAIPATSAWNNEPLFHSQSNQYNERFVVRGTGGIPIPNLYFGIKRSNGSIEYGTTNENGETDLMLSKEEAETVEVFIAG
ncbi:PAAR domain-containing protein [Collimonas silvisoli]|uniref:PAAR domain-containing protein n=1 Tax=Collimonas silvisoli TaxID=2825884 RepID=UPI001B8AEACE|nr:PAAR domain-containing protein [Collimonas silvisoli]